MKKFICGVLIGSICTLTVGSIASGIWDNISVLKNDINVVVNGQNVTADNFLYNDTTYLPLRAVSEALGKSVRYNEATNTAYIGESEVAQMNNKNEFEGKYDPKNYADKLSKLDIHDVNVHLIDSKYYIEVSVLLQYVGEGKYNSAENKVYYTIGGAEKGFSVTPSPTEHSCISFDDFIDEILPFIE